MIPVAKAPEPADFDLKVRQTGLRLLNELTGVLVLSPRSGPRRKVVASRKDHIPPTEYKPYWTKCLGDLMTAYDFVCAYTCIRIHPGTGARSVDHFFPKSQSWDQVYEWSNYRLCCTQINAKKGTHPDVIDPFLVQPDWFELELVGFQVLPGKDLDAPTRSRVQANIDRLDLNAFKNYREAAAEDYWRGDIKYNILQRESPFVARELKRQGRTRAGD
jgi:5-methylcytosine-specific restriction endonuclease McrA